MIELVKLIIGIIILILGIPLGNFLAKNTKEELKSGRKWIRILVLIGLIGGLTGLIFGNDFLMFGFFFVAIVTSRGLGKINK